MTLAPPYLTVLAHSNSVDMTVDITVAVRWDYFFSQSPKSSLFKFPSHFSKMPALW